MRLGGVRAQPEHLREAGRSRPRLPERLQHAAEIVVEGRIGRVDRERAADEPGGFGVAAEPVGDDALQMQRAGMVRLLCGQAPASRLGGAELAGLVLRHGRGESVRGGPWRHALSTLSCCGLPMIGTQATRAGRPPP